MLRYSKEILHELSYREENGYFHHVKKYEVGETRLLVHYLFHLIAKEIFPEDTGSFRFSTIGRHYCDDFLNHADDISLVSSKGA